MARKPKQGIDYFPLDVGFLQDPKIKRLRQKRGCVGVTIYLDTVAQMYGGKGYFVAYDDDLVYELMDDTSGRYAPNEDVVRAVIEDCISLGLLSRVGNSEIITAHRVQVQFYLTTKRRKDIIVDCDKWLLSMEEMEQLGADSPIYHFFISANKNGINVSKNGVFAGNNPQSKRESNSNTHTLSAPARDSEPQAPSVEEVQAYFAAHGVTDPIEITEFLRYNEARGWSCLPAWEQKANLWIAKVPKARREFSERQKRETQKAGRKPQSFDTDSFMEAALRKSYHNEQ